MSYWNPRTGFDPFAYEQHRALATPDRRACCYPPVVGSVVELVALVYSDTKKPMRYRIEGYNDDGFWAKDVREFSDKPLYLRWVGEEALNRRGENLVRWRWVD